MASVSQSESTWSGDRAFLAVEYNGYIMTSQPDVSPSIAEICASVKRLGYGVSQNIRLYGEEFEVISDPFPESGGIAVSVRTKQSDGIRVLHLPATVLQSVQGRRAA